MTEKRSSRRERLKRDLERAAPLIYLPEPVRLLPGSKIRVLGGTAEALALTNPASSSTTH